MKIIRNIFLGLLAVILLGIGAIYTTGNGALLTIVWAVYFGGPELPFDPNDAVAPPDYSNPESWAALQAGSDESSKTKTASLTLIFRSPSGPPN